MSNFRIGLDLDGVVYNYDKTSRYMLRSMRGYSKDSPLGQEATSWTSTQEFVKPEDWKWLWSEGIKLGLFRYGHLYKGSIEGIRSLANLGDIIVITHRHPDATQDTLDWLSYLRLPFKEVHVFSRGEPKSSVKCDFYIDDKPENIEDLYKNTEGIPALWRRPWNEHFGTAEDKLLVPYYVVESWKEVVDIATRLRRKG